MVWPFPPSPDAHDPVTWGNGMGRFDEARWRNIYEDLFATYALVHNRREIARITAFPAEDGGFAVVDVDTLWRHRGRGDDFHWLGRACKAYALVNGELKMTMHTGLLSYR
jgi:hypothetical protein